MKMTGITIASLAALLGGGKLVLAGFAPVLPTDFDRRWEPDYAAVYWAARYMTREQAEFYNLRGRWAESVEDLLLNGRNGDGYRDWRARNERGFRGHIEHREKEMVFRTAEDGTSVVTYRSVDVIEGRYEPTGRLACTVRLDVDYARAWREWFAMPGARASTRLPDHLDPWSGMECRRTSGLRHWLAWTGLDRYREPPPERYSAVTYAQRAWQRAGLDLAPAR